MSDQPINADVAGAAANTGEPQVTDTAPAGGTDGNPAWAELLGVLPSSLHPTVKPYLDKWDKTAQDRITRVQSEYTPYKEFLTTPPEQLQASMQLAQMIATDPRAFYDRMTEYYGEEWGLGQGLDTDNADDDFNLDEEDTGDQQIDLSDNPLLQQIQEQQDTIAKVLAAQLQERQANEEKAATEAATSEIMAEMGTIAKQYGFAEGLPPELERMVLSLALQNEGVTLTQAAQQVMAIAQPKQPMPRIISPGGGVPAGGIDTRNMNSKDTKSLVATILEQQHNAQNG